MKRLTRIILTASLFLILGAGAYAGHDGKPVTPYGDYCSRFNHYGMHRERLDQDQIRKALYHYYKSKGLNIMLINTRGRFIKAHIMDGKRVVDTIIFDHYTGRIRSIY